MRKRRNENVKGKNNGGLLFYEYKYFLAHSGMTIKINK